MSNPILNRVNTALEKFVPEQRLTFKSAKSARVVRLRPLTQLAALGGSSVVIGWTILASSVLAIDTLGSGSAKTESARAQTAFETRLEALSAERDLHAAEAVESQRNFARALDQVSRIQAELLRSEQERRALETGLTVAQSRLHDALSEKRDAQLASAPEAAEAIARAPEMALALDVLNEELRATAAARDEAVATASAARAEAEIIAQEQAMMVAHTDQIFQQLEDAVTVSVKPFEDMFSAAGIDADRLLSTIDSGYAGIGGPLNPAIVSTSGNAEISQRETRAQEIMISLDQVNRYRIAASRVPLAMPVRQAHRFTSGFGPRWGRLHAGVDFAGPVGTPIHAAGDGVVKFAGWQRGYGNIVIIEHALGTETRYAHLNRFHVRQGQNVSRDDHIADMGNTGRSTGPHLHYEVRVNGTAVNPMNFIQAAENVF
ncbi:MAG: DUF5930 domain-containing protein [Paracoccus sp. (in: a-proteobacteria)]|nr:DUF5930 domain-containing protein [Paracoccus sp. (in: a-proteobacteria)]